MGQQSITQYTAPSHWNTVCSIYKARRQEAQTLRYPEGLTRALAFDADHHRIYPGWWWITDEEYLLTEKGLDLIPVLVELANWSAQYDPQTGAPAAWIALMKTEREPMIRRICETVQRGGSVFAGENSLFRQVLSCDHTPGTGA